MLATHAIVDSRRGGGSLGGAKVVKKLKRYTWDMLHDSHFRGIYRLRLVGDTLRNYPIAMRANQKYPSTTRRRQVASTRTCGSASWLRSTWASVPWASGRGTFRVVEQPLEAPILMRSGCLTGRLMSTDGLQEKADPEGSTAVG